jgi:hypothetical protein
MQRCALSLSYKTQLVLPLEDFSQPTACHVISWRHIPAPAALAAPASHPAHPGPRDRHPPHLPPPPPLPSPLPRLPASHPAPRTAPPPPHHLPWLPPLPLPTNAPCLPTPAPSSVSIKLLLHAMLACFSRRPATCSPCRRLPASSHTRRRVPAARYLQIESFQLRRSSRARRPPGHCTRAARPLDRSARAAEPLACLQAAAPLPYFPGADGLLPTPTAPGQQPHALTGARGKASARACSPAVAAVAMASLPTPHWHLLLPLQHRGLAPPASELAPPSCRRRRLGGYLRERESERVGDREWTDEHEGDRDN